MVWNQGVVKWTVARAGEAGTLEFSFPAFLAKLRAVALVAPGARGQELNVASSYKYSSNILILYKAFIGDMRTLS